MSGILSGAYELADPPCSLDAHTYIECGLGHNGDSFENARKYGYARLIGIEVCWRHYINLKHLFDCWSRVTIRHGSTVDVLREVLERDFKTLILLDSHFTNNGDDEMDPKVGQCPLLKELEIIASVPWVVKPTLLIHDASMFTGKFWKQQNVPKEFDREQWPSLGEIVETVAEMNYRFAVRRDFIWMW